MTSKQIASLLLQQQHEETQPKSASPVKPRLRQVLDGDMLPSTLSPSRKPRASSSAGLWLHPVSESSPLEEANAAADAGDAPLAAARGRRGGSSPPLPNNTMATASATMRSHHRGPPPSSLRTRSFSPPKRRETAFRCHGAGLEHVTVRRAATFFIEAIESRRAESHPESAAASSSVDAANPAAAQVRDELFISIRGVSRVRARIVPVCPGKYEVEWRPPLSGRYSVSVSNFGLPLPGSPFTVLAVTPEPHAPNCSVKGEALTNGIARQTSSFDVTFRDATDAVTNATDLDVFVEPVQTGSPRGSVQQQLAAGGVTAKSGRMCELRVVLGGGEPLDVRSSCEADSPIIGALQPGAVITVIEERRENGNVHSAFALDFIRNSDGVGIRQSDGSKFVRTDAKQHGVNARSSRGSTLKSRALTYRSSSLATNRAAVASPSSRGDGQGSLMFPKSPAAPKPQQPSPSPQPASAATLQPQQLKPSSEPSKPTPGIQPQIEDVVEGKPAATSGHEKMRKRFGSKLVLPAPALQRQFVEQNASLVGNPLGSSERGASKHSQRTTPGAMDSSAGGGLISGLGSHRAQSSNRSPQVSQRSGLGSHRKTGGRKGARSGRESRAMVGWVTTVKDGRPLVSSKVRLEVTDRQKFEQQWTRRQEAEKSTRRQEEFERKLVEGQRLRRKSKENEDEDEEEGRQLFRPPPLPGRSGTSGSGAASTVSPHQKIVRSLAMELAGARSANDLAAFAFGGVYPGTLHAHGRLLPSHKVYFSVGVAGRYLLHVRLRQEAAPVPGSPFLLEVKPGPAHALSTRMPPWIEGEVGGRCSLQIHGSDIMGNRCIEGGAKVAVETVARYIKTSYRDNDDGTYTVCGTASIATPSALVIASLTPELLFFLLALSSIRSSSSMRSARGRFARLYSSTGSTS